MSRTVRFDPDEVGEDSGYGEGRLLHGEGGRDRGEPGYVGGTRGEGGRVSSRGEDVAVGEGDPALAGTAAVDGTVAADLDGVQTAGEKRFYRPIRTFARRGDRMGDTLERTFQKYRGAYLLDLPRGVTPTAVAAGTRLDVRVVFGREAPLIVEVGCGNGEQITAAAAQNPDVNFLGFEVWLPGVAKAVSNAVRVYDGLPNLRITDLDAVQALPILFGLGEDGGEGTLREGGSEVRELWTFFADPWPKARHKKRRLVGPEFGRVAAAILEDGGLWRLATDWDDDAWQQRNVIESTPGLVNDFAGKRPDSRDPEGDRGGFAPRFEGRVVTAFERRAGREGRDVHDLCARRLERGSAQERASLQAFGEAGRDAGWAAGRDADRAARRAGIEGLTGTVQGEKPADSGWKPRPAWYE